MKKSKLITTMAAIAATTSIAPITMISCGNVTTYEVTIEEGEINASHNVTISKTQATANKQFDAVIDWDNKENGRIEDYSVNIGGNPLQPFQVTVDPISGAISIPKELVTGKISITVKIVNSVFEIGKKEGSIDFELSDPTLLPHYNQDYTNTISINEKYLSLVTNFEIYIGRSSAPLLRGDDYIIDPFTGVFTIYGKSVTDNVYINIEAVEGLSLTMDPSQKIRYVNVIDGLRIAEYRINCSATLMHSANLDLNLDVQIDNIHNPVWGEYSQSIKVAYKKFDSANNQIVVGISSDLATIDTDLFEKVFNMHIKISNVFTPLATADFENLLFENVIASTPDMLLYSDSKKTVTGPNNDDPRWLTCEALVIPKSVVKIDRGAFGGFGSYKESSNVKWLILDETFGDWAQTGEQCQLKVIGQTAFQAINCLKSGILYIPSSVEQIDTCAFAMLKTDPSVVNVVFGQNSQLTNIGDSCFNGSISCRNTLKIPSNVKTISRNAFKGTSFSTLDFSEATALEEIGASSSSEFGTTFKAMTSLTGEIVLPNNLKIIRRHSFACEDETKSNNVTSVTIPASTTKIEDEAFANLINLKTIDMSQWDSTEAIQTNWGKNVFINCAKTGVIKVKNQQIADDMLIILKSKGLPTEGWTASWE